MSLFDKRAALQVIGCVLHDPVLIDQYSIEAEDFEEDFHNIVFSAIHNLYAQNISVIDAFAIDGFLSTYEKQYKIFNENNGIKYVESAKKLAEPANFEYHYNKLKKLSLLRYYRTSNVDITPIYDYTATAPEAQEEQKRKLDSYSIENIIDEIETSLVITPRLKYSSVENEGQLAGEGLLELIKQCQQTPEIGIPMQSNTMNNICRGARLKKFYLRSAPSGVGKTRLAIGDICSYSIPWFYSTDSNDWVYTGFAEPSLFITTELEIDEVQSMILAFVSGVPEDKILDGAIQGEEYERVTQAAQYIASSPLYIEYMAEFNIDDIANLIRKYKKERGVMYISFDYIHTSVKLLMQMADISKGMKFQEYQVLYIFATQLKSLCNKLNVHIDSATQVNGEYKNARIKDETLLRGSKAIADRIDVGMIAMQPTSEELKAIEPIMNEGIRLQPNLIYHIYKVRRGKLSHIRLWMHADLSTCRTVDLFVTDNDNKLIPMEGFLIENVDATLEEYSEDVTEETAVLPWDIEDGGVDVPFVF